MIQEKKKTPAAGSRRRLRKFVVCLILFGLVLAGRGLDLAPVERAAAAVSRIVQRDTDFRAVFAQMGESFSRGEPAEETFRVLWQGLLPWDREDQAEEPEEAEPETVEET